MLCLSIVSIQNVNKNQKNAIRVFGIMNSARMGLNRRSSLWSSTAFLNCLEFSDRYRCMINSQHNSRKLWKTTKRIWSSISLLIEIDEKLAYNSQIISSSSHLLLILFNLIYNLGCFKIFMASFQEGFSYMLIFCIVLDWNNFLIH